MNDKTKEILKLTEYIAVVKDLEGKFSSYGDYVCTTTHLKCYNEVLQDTKEVLTEDGSPLNYLTQFEHSLLKSLLKLYSK